MRRSSWPDASAASAPKTRATLSSHRSTEGNWRESFAIFMRTLHPLLSPCPTRYRHAPPPPVSSSLFYTTSTRHAPLCPFKQKSKSRHEARSFRRVSSAHQRPSRGSPAKTWNHPSRFFATRSHVRRPFLKKNNTQTTPDRTVGLRNRPNQPFSPFFVFLVVVVEEQTTTTTTLLHRSSHFCLCSFFLRGIH